MATIDLTPTSVRAVMKGMRTGELSTSHTSLFRSTCGCKTLVQIREGAEVPPCPVCNRPVSWVSDGEDGIGPSARAAARAHPRPGIDRGSGDGPAGRRA